MRRQWPIDKVTFIADQREPGDLPDRLVELFAQVADVALFYYVGHGQIDEDNELCLGLVNSRLEQERRATTSLTFGTVRRARRLLDEAERVAATAAEPDRQYYAMVTIAEARLREDPARGRQLLEHSERLAKRDVEGGQTLRATCRDRAPHAASHFGGCRARGHGRSRRHSVTR